MSTLSVVLLIGAILRLTRVVTTDRIAERPRAWLESRSPTFIGYAVRCDWCMSVWVGIAVFALGWYAPDGIRTVLSGALTASWLAGWAGYADTAAWNALVAEDDG